MRPGPIRCWGQAPGIENVKKEATRTPNSQVIFRSLCPMPYARTHATQRRQAWLCSLIMLEDRRNLDARDSTDRSRMRGRLWVQKSVAQSLGMPAPTQPLHVAGSPETRRNQQHVERVKHPSKVPVCPKHPTPETREQEEPQLLVGGKHWTTQCRPNYERTNIEESQRIQLLSHPPNQERTLKTRRHPAVWAFSETTRNRSGPPFSCRV